MGGHCIGVDPFYLAFKAKEVGYSSELILQARQINEGMPKVIVERTIKMIVANKLNLSHVKIGIFGITFKENTPDTRNSKVVDIYIKALSSMVSVLIYMIR